MRSHTGFASTRSSHMVSCSSATAGSSARARTTHPAEPNLRVIPMMPSAAQAKPNKMSGPASVRITWSTPVTRRLAASISASTSLIAVESSGRAFAVFMPQTY